MDGKKKVGIISLVVGTVILVLSLVAYLIGIGFAPGFGGIQTVGTCVVIVARLMTLKK